MHNVLRRVAKRATMYFAYGKDKRPGVTALTTFLAIWAGERTSTTRFDVWPGSESWGRLVPGDVVRFFEDKAMNGRHLDVVVDEVRRVDLRVFTPEQFEAWSRAEGWSVAHAQRIAARGMAWQILYHLADGEAQRLAS